MRQNADYKGPEILVAMYRATGEAGTDSDGRDFHGFLRGVLVSHSMVERAKKRVEIQATMTNDWERFWVRDDAGQESKNQVFYLDQPRKESKLTVDDPELGGFRREFPYPQHNNSPFRKIHIRHITDKLRHAKPQLFDNAIYVHELERIINMELRMLHAISSVSLRTASDPCPNSQYVSMADNYNTVLNFGRTVYRFMIWRSDLWKGGEKYGDPSTIIHEQFDKGVYFDRHEHEWMALGGCRVYGVQMSYCKRPFEYLNPWDSDHNIYFPNNDPVPVPR